MKKLLLLLITTITLIGCAGHQYTGTGYQATFDGHYVPNVVDSE